ncbi:DeoR/GlpR family DNA-binding transcription regulator [Roseovarius dicentrarchi]|uniref:DeoR/GlpR family DNA-binding transcription regulator n=1 Tax=Roseovarius dicentrarchi TaxID=2250573 RepID=UPI001EEF9D08|nr:DeoR/GlpR family DNA-binding transcription regulator [Roseovarius dicentrarchi]
MSRTTNQREEEILREIQKAGGTCRIGFLASQLGVSQETVRRNIRSLEQSGAVRKVHGGVHLVDRLDEPPFQNRMDRNGAIKQRLARRVAEIIGDEKSVFLDVGSSTAYAAMALRDCKKLMVVSNSIYVAQMLAMRNDNRVFLAGGELRSHDGGAFGAEALDLVQRFNVEFAVFSVGAINADKGFMLHDFQEANIARVVARNAQTKIVIADSEKFGKRAPVVVDYSNQIDILVTNAQPPADICNMLARHEIELVIA